jgi:hypothetical protein
VAAWVKERREGGKGKEEGRKNWWSFEGDAGFEFTVPFSSFLYFDYLSWLALALIGHTWPFVVAAKMD